MESIEDDSPFLKSYGKILSTVMASEVTGAKRKRDQLSDDEDEGPPGKKWDDPEILDDMGLSKLGSDTYTDEDEGDITEILGSDTDEENPHPAKKRKMGHQTRKPLGEQPSTNIMEPKNCRLEDSKLEKLKPAPCVIKNSQVTYGGNDLKLSRLSLTPMGPNYFEMLPDELVLEVLKKVDRRTLVQCCYVSRRLNRIAKEESLWYRVDLAGKRVPEGGLGHMLLRGPRIVRMASACVPDKQFLNLSRNFTCKIEYLDLSMTMISAECLAKLLSYCTRLKKLSLENCMLNDNVMAAVSQNGALEVLNLTMCSGISAKGIHKLLSKCLYLQSLNLGWANLSAKSIEVVTELLPPNLERLNLTGCRHNLRDAHVLEILKRCDSLLELDISDCIDLTEATVNHLIQFGWSLEYLGISRCYAIPIDSIRELSKLDSLVFLDMFGLCSEAELKQLRQHFESKIKLNQFTFSSVARPTVGIRRTSIWGLRVRE